MTKPKFERDETIDRVFLEKRASFHFWLSWEAFYIYYMICTYNDRNACVPIF